MRTQKAGVHLDPQHPLHCPGPGRRMKRPGGCKAGHGRAEGAGRPAWADSGPSCWGSVWGFTWLCSGDSAGCRGSNPHARRVPSPLCSLSGPRAPPLGVSLGIAAPQPRSPPGWPLLPLTLGGSVEEASALLGCAGSGAPIPALRCSYSLWGADQGPLKDLKEAAGREAPHPKPLIN